MFVTTPKFIQALFPSLIWRKETNHKEIWLTFDDGPDPEVTPWILNILKQKNIKIKQILGKAGTVVLFNSSYIHRGKNIESGERFSLTNYFFKSNIISKYMRNRQFKHLYIPKK